MARQTQPRATIVDIARLSGVSTSTVSLVLRGSHLVRPETRERVEAAGRQLGYVYNRSAANLRAARSHIVGMVIGDLMNPFFTELAVGIEEALHARGFVPLLANTDESRTRQAGVLRAMREHPVAGIVLSPARGTLAADLDEVGRAVPVVLASRTVEGFSYPYVGADNVEAGRLACEHLLGLGHRRLGFLGGDPEITTCTERLGGCRAALGARGLGLDDALVFAAPPTREGGMQAISVALEGGEPPSAMVCYNDLVALGAMQELGRRGLSCGRDVSLVGFDDIVEGRYGSVPLTSVNLGTRAVGGQAAHRLLDLIDGAEGDAREGRHLGPVRLMVRGSSGPPVRGGARPRAEALEPAALAGGVVA